MREVIDALAETLRAGKRAALLTVVRATGSTPRTAGARMLVRPDGSTVGTIGGGAFEAMAIQDALDALGLPDVAPALKRYAFTETGDDALGMACGGNAEVLIEPLGAGPKLIVFGAGHVGMALARLAATVGFEVTLVDDREEACAAARRAGVGTVHRCDASWRDVPKAPPESFAAVVTRCHRTDRLALAALLREPPRYVGLIGSRRKKAVIFRELAAEDEVPGAVLDRVHCPIGLPIGGETPEEIAVSIVAELQQERYHP